MLQNEEVVETPEPKRHSALHPLLFVSCRFFALRAITEVYPSSQGLLSENSRKETPVFLPGASFYWHDIHHSRLP